MPRDKKTIHRATSDVEDEVISDEEEENPKVELTESNTNTKTNTTDLSEERKKFLNWLWDFEFNLYGLPIPSEVFFLNMPVEKSLELMANRENKFTHGAKKDIHESDKNHLIDAL